jgi:trans-2,3-dihydro-3-hydroxyanthranilate isomerase
MVQKDPTVGATHDPRSVAKALHVPLEALDEKLPIQTISTGVPFAIVPFRSLEALRRIQPEWSSMEGYLRSSDASYFYLLARETVDRSATAHARMIFSGGEDPATGSAAGPAFAWMVWHGLVPPGQSAMIEQGIEIHRTSRIYGRVDLQEGRPVNVRVGGHCVPVIEGELAL